MKKAILVLCLVVVGCATSSGVFQSGKDTYTVIVGGNASIGILQKQAYREASEFCKNLGKKMQPVYTNKVYPDFFTVPSFELRFLALDENDPLYGRPTLEPMPDVKVNIE